MAQRRLTPKEKRQRRVLRALTVVVFTFATLVLAWFLESRETTTILFVRHADVDAAVAGEDPPLNARGRARAELLADYLVDVDVVSGVNAIYASAAQRTQQTAAPLAERLKLEVQIADHSDSIGFMRNVLRDHAGDIVLIVSHSNTIPVLIDELHGKKGIEFRPDEYDTLYIVTRPAFGRRVKTLRLPYAAGWQPPHDAATH